MGTSYRRLQVEVTGSTGGFTAAMNAVERGVKRVGQGLRGGANDANVFSKQIMAIGTTARYALAGQLVFGITAGLQRLQDFKNELGVLDSLAGQIDKNQNFHSLGNQLEGVGSQAILMSNKLGIAVGDVESYMQRFFSSFDVTGSTNARLDAMQGFVDRVAQLQAMMGAEAGDPQALAGGIAGLVNQIPGGNKNIPGNTAKIANMIAYLTRVTPNITGRDVARDIGRVGSTMTIGRMTPEQAFAVWGVAGMAGGSSSVIGRGVAQLLGTALLHPSTKGQRAAYLQAGLPIDPTQLRKMGGFNVLMKMLDATGGSRSLTGRQQAIINDENLSDADANAALGGTGINLTRIYGLLGSHQESVRQFVNLLGQGGTKALREYIKHQQQAIKVDQARQRYEAAIRQRGLARFQQGRQNLSMQMMDTLDPAIETLFGAPTIWLSDEMAKHRTVARVGVAGGAGLLAANALRKLGVFSKLGTIKGLGKFGKVGSLLGKAADVQRDAIGAALTAEALPSAIAGGAADGSRGNPYWVVIHPMSWSVGSPGGFSQPVKKPNGPEEKAANAIKKILPVAAGAAARFAPTAGAGLGMAGLGIALPLTALGLGAYYGRNTYGTAKSAEIDNMLKNVQSGNGIFGPFRAPPPIQVQGEAALTIDVNQHNADGTTTRHRKRAHIQITPAKQFPTKQGKPGSRKAGK